MAAASYNYMPNQHSKEAPFFVMFGRDAVTNIGHITTPRYRYMGTEDLILDLEIMSNIYQCQIINLQLGKTSCTQTKSWRHSTVTKDRPGSGRSGSHKRPYKQKHSCLSIKLISELSEFLVTRVEVKDNHGKLSFYHISDIKKTDMITKLICQLPDHDAFGEKRAT